jgi:hypothetical protein
MEKMDGKMDVKMDGKKGEKIFSPNIHLFFYNPFVPKSNR